MNFRRLFIVAGGLMVALIVGFGTTAFRSVRVVNDAAGMYQDIKYLVESGGSISTAPAETALSANYLEIIFGDNPQLLAELLEIIAKGMKDNPDIRMGEVAAILVTYRQNDGEAIKDVVAHIVGEFSLGRRTVTMHPQGFMANRMDENLWNTGQSAIRLLGRDIAVWAKDETIERPQQEIIEAIFAGEIMVVAKSLADQPLYFTAVFPAPREVVPMRMRPHVRAILMNGFISPTDGSMEMVALCNDERSAERVETMFTDIFDSVQVAMETRFGGSITETAWSDGHVETWWAYEIANTIENMAIKRNDRTVSMAADYDRQMVNAMMKVVERFGRDYSAIRGVQDEKINPQEVQDFMQGNPFTPRWTEQHEWGPDWPFPPTSKDETPASEDESVQETGTPTS